MQPERVDPPPAEQLAPPPRKRFEEVLRVRADRPVRRPPAPPRRRSSAVTPRADGHTAGRVASRAGELRGEARQQMDGSARQRVADGNAAAALATGRLDARAAELLRAALRTEEARRSDARPHAGTGHPGAGRPAEPAPGVPDVQTSQVGGTVPSAGTGAAPAAARVERALALVERIERFVRSGRPALALTLRGGLPGHLELQRIAPGAIAIRLSSTRPPSATELLELRQALEARGLSVRSLEARSVTASAADACSPCP